MSTDKPNKKEQFSEGMKGYGGLVWIAVIFGILMAVTTAASVHFLGQSIDPSVISTVSTISHGHLGAASVQVFSSLIVAINVILSILSVKIFKKLVHTHKEKQLTTEPFKLKLWPMIGMGLLVSLAIGIFVAMIYVTDPYLKGIDPISIYQALDSGSIYGILSVLIVLPIVGFILIALAPRAYHYIEDFDKRHHIPDIPDVVDKLSKPKENPEDKSKTN